MQCIHVCTCIWDLAAGIQGAERIKLSSGDLGIIARRKYKNEVSLQCQECGKTYLL